MAERRWRLLLQVTSSDVAAMDRACRRVVNDASADAPSRTPELLAKYCDILLKKAKTGSHQDLRNEAARAPP